jgi:hypothetical protein
MYSATFFQGTLADDGIVDPGGSGDDGEVGEVVVERVLLLRFGARVRTAFSRRRSFYPLLC